MKVRRPDRYLRIYQEIRGLSHCKRAPVELEDELEEEQDEVMHCQVIRFFIFLQLNFCLLA